MANAKMKAVTGLWVDIGVADINRILKPHGVRLVKTTKKAWGSAVSITAHKIEDAPAAERVCPPHHWSTSDAGPTVCLGCGILREDALA